MPQLRPISKEDYPFIYECQTDLRNLHLWWEDRDLYSYESFVDDFQRRLRRFIHTFCIIEHNNEPVGFIYNYNTDFVDKYTYLCVYLKPEATAQGLGKMVTYDFLKFLYTQFGFRKVYAEIKGYNEPSLKITQRNGFVEEGCLKNHTWFDGKYWDLYIMTLYLTKKLFE
ncbi:MAG: GNAT family N-acetyltransferase [Cytophagales bacterium]|nr:GNAT family N-acetyltransferase [Cytophagales bacterium]